MAQATPAAPATSATPLLMAMTKDGRMGFTLGLEQQKEPSYQVAYHMYIASGRRLSGVESVEQYLKHSLKKFTNYVMLT